LYSSQGHGNKESTNASTKESTNASTKESTKESTKDLCLLFLLHVPVDKERANHKPCSGDSLIVGGPRIVFKRVHGHFVRTLVAGPNGVQRGPGEV
jgi:hypothetical protein